MNKKGLGEFGEIISSFILILVVLLFSYTVFGIMARGTTTEIGAGSYSDWIDEGIIQEIDFGILSMETEYGDLATLIASKEESKVKDGIEKIQNKIKEKIGKDVVINIYTKDDEEKLKEESKRFVNPYKISFPDLNGDKIIVLIPDKK